MFLQAIVQSLFSGIFIGAIYGMAAVGLSLAFGVMRYLNIAHGALIMIGAYVSFSLFTVYGIDPFLSIPLTMLTLFLIGMFLYITTFFTLAKFHEETRIKNSLLISFGLMLVLDNLGILLWTADVRTITTSYSGMAFEFFSLRLSYVGLIGLGLTFIFIFALHLFLTRTYFGKSIRATSQDYEMAMAMGVNVGWTYLISFAIGAALASVAGTFLAVSYGITPMMGEAWTIKALIIIILAGLGRIGGVFVAGILLGVVETVSVYFIGAPYQEVVGLVIFILILMFRPQGLFSKRTGA
jgi:branched-chain amino acid transport system permease protein